MQRWLGVGLILWLSVGCQRPVPAQGATASAAVACLGEGEGSSAYEEAQTAARGAQAPSCCEGLTRLESYEPAMQPGQCLASKGGRFTCARCGDGQCLQGENHCNCASDCP
jgi:hypothetical protein